MWVGLVFLVAFVPTVVDATSSLLKGSLRHSSPIYRPTLPADCDKLSEKDGAGKLKNKEIYWTLKQVCLYAGGAPRSVFRLGYVPLRSLMENALRLTILPAVFPSCPSDGLLDAVP